MQLSLAAGAGTGVGVGVGHTNHTTLRDHRLRVNRGAGHVIPPSNPRHHHGHQNQNNNANHIHTGAIHNNHGQQGNQHHQQQHQQQQPRGDALNHILHLHRKFIRIFPSY